VGGIGVDGVGLGGIGGSWEYVGCIAGVARPAIPAECGGMNGVDVG